MKSYCAGCKRPIEIMNKNSKKYCRICLIQIKKKYKKKNGRNRK